MIPVILLLLLIAPAWSLAQETEELSLVEAARRERERRASITVEVKILTNRDVEEMEGLVSTSTAPDTSEEVGDKGEPDDWGELFDSAKLDLKTAESRLQVLQLQMVYLRDQWLRQSDGVTQQKIRDQLQETEKGLEISRQNTEAAGAAYQELQQKAKAAGVFPGELRELMSDDS
ncbi:MAG: hypothetical protein E2O55_03945 [Gammaproteobacteria bacterium]|nr:MAG: hypothetical protein E2O55_03945 [Gammaproteobacteria bacterium]